jgi:hypothetical protein
MDATTKLSSRHLCSKRILLFANLICIIALVSLTVVSVFSDVSPFVAGGVAKVVVSNESELIDAVYNASEPTTIAFDKDVKLSSYLHILNKHITLTSNSNTKFFKLIGANGQSTIEIADGVLTIDGIIVTHETGSTGSGVFVNNPAKLIMHRGEISGNTADKFAGGGVRNSGTFEMHGGKITNNQGSGVTTGRSFIMSGGEITNNKATGQGRFSEGGGVNVNTGTFSMTGGKISGNTATYGGGVNVYSQAPSGSFSFSMSGGTITDNEATRGGGVCVQYSGTFSRTGGVISGNAGGDVYPNENSNSSFDDGNNNSSNGNGDSTDGNNSTSAENESSLESDNGSTDEHEFSLSNAVFICLCVTGVVVGVVVGVLFFTSKKTIS